MSHSRPNASTASCRQPHRALPRGSPGSFATATYRTLAMRYLLRERDPRLPSEAVAHLGGAQESESNATGCGVGGSLLDEIVRDGARAMLTAALPAEVAAYIDAHRDQVDGAGHRLVVRNGYHGSGVGWRSWVVAQ